MQSAPARIRRDLAVFAAVLVLVAGSARLPAPTRAAVDASAAVGASMEGSLRSWINRDRAGHGLRALRVDMRLDALSGERASWMAAKGQLTHDGLDGSACDAMTKRSIYWYGCGEDIGFTTASWGTSSAAFLYDLWRHSPAHWALMMSSRFNYFGVGVARRSNGSTYAAIVFLEGPDHTQPIARMRTRTVTGRNIKFTWSAKDIRLQTHTAGIKNYNVELRVDNGAYVQIRTATQKTSLSLLNRARGHWYSVRVQARDKRGNLSAWSHGLRAWVP
jgi:uncharacterized protein YkwD